MCLLIAGVLVLLDAGAVTGAWRFLSKRAVRPPLARPVGALLGAATGAMLVGPQLLVLTDLACDHFRRDSVCNASLPVPLFYLFPFALPLTTGLFAWLLAEIIGGRAGKPFFTVGWTLVGAVLGAAAFFLPLVLVPDADRTIPRPMRAPLMFTLPALGALLALALAHRRLASLGEQKRA